MSTKGMKPGHLFTSRSGPNYHHAACECGHLLAWDTREEEHARHLLAIVWAEGADLAARTAVTLGAPTDLPERVQAHNPYQVSLADAAKRAL